MLADNLYVEGVSTPVIRRDGAGNTFQIRRLDDGGTFEIVKNYPTGEQLAATLKPWGTAIEHQTLDHFWFVTYRAR